MANNITTHTHTAAEPIHPTTHPPLQLLYQGLITPPAWSSSSDYQDGRLTAVADVGGGMCACPAKCGPTVGELGRCEHEWRTRGPNC